MDEGEVVQNDDSDDEWEDDDVKTKSKGKKEDAEMDGANKKKRTKKQAM